jgi:hypothetical protein
MNKILIPWLCLFSFYSLADQGDLLAQQRDHYLENSLGLLKKYCPDVNEYVCRQQLELDCSHGIEDKKKLACPELAKIKGLEKQVLSSDKNLAEIDHINLPSLSAPVKEVAPLILPQVTAQVKPTDPNYHAVSIKLGLNLKLAREQKAPSEEIKKIVDQHEKINSQKIRVDCETKSDCEYQSYGHNPCGGPMGYFAYSKKGGESEKVISEIKAFNAASEVFEKKWNVGAIGMCAYWGPTEEVGCGNNVCR